MKKNISINISGIIFHIEEDGYNDLKSYLESITNYFSSYDDSHEIIADIESRIAEIFLSKLDDSKQVILLEDVKGLIDTMGTIADFEAVEEEPVHDHSSDAGPEQQEKHADKEPETAPKDDPGKRRLFRDEKRKVIGGVAAGMGYYLSIDPLWIRLVFVVLLLNLFIQTFSGLIFLTYVILWIVVPGSKTLGEDENVKKMFRDPESRVLGGVGSGLAAYFGIDVTIIRLLFVVSVFFSFGATLLLYIILWIITPEAKSITEKMQMQGEPVTLSNIQHSIKKSLSDEKGEESALAKVLLFPFRLLAVIFEALGKALGPIGKVLGEVIRVFAGALITFVGIVTMISLIAALLLSWGWLPALREYSMFGGWPVELLPMSFSGWTFMVVFVACFVPWLFVSLLGVSILAKRMVIQATFGWPIFGAWILSLICLAVMVPMTFADFAKSGEYRSTQEFLIEDEPVTLRMNYLDGPELSGRVLKLRGHNDSTFQLVKVISARGSSRSNALENARMADYNVVYRDAQLLFDSKLTFDQNAKLRWQQIDMILYIPFGQTFKIEESMEGMISSTFSRAGYDPWQINEEHTWVFTPDGLQCVTCKKRKVIKKDSSLEYYDSTQPKDDERVTDFDLSNFNEVVINGYFKVIVTQEKEYDVKVFGGDDYIEDIMVKQFGNTLEINTTKKNWDLLKDWSDDQKIKVYISLPYLRKLKSGGVCAVAIDGFDQDEFELILSGGSTGSVDIETKELSVDLSGGSWVELHGNTDYANASISGASSLRASDLKANYFEVTATGVSNARVDVKKRLVVDVSGLSNVKYDGDPELKINNRGGMSSVSPAD